MNELEERSPEFADPWSRREVIPHSSGRRVIRHSVHGELRLRISKLAFPGSEGLQIVIYYADPEIPSASE